MREAGLLTGLRWSRLAAGASVIAMTVGFACPAFADPPVVVTVPYVGDDGVTGNITFVLASQRNLDEPLPDLSTFGPATSLLTADVPAAAAFWDGCFTLLGPGNTVVAQGAGVCGTGSPSVSTEFRDANGTAIGFFLVSSNPGGTATPGLLSFSYSLTDTQVTNTTSVGGGIQAIVRIADTETPLATATALTLAEAQSEALSQTDFGFTRGRILPAIVNAGGVTESEVINSTVTRLTGRDDYLAEFFTLGPGTIVVGQRGRCAGFINTCESGIRFRVLPGTSAITEVTHTDFYTTTTIDRTVTSTGTAFIDIPIAHEGVAHAAAQTVGFDLGDRFLRRLVTPGAAGHGAALGRTGDAARWNVFLEGAGGTGDLGVNDRHYFSVLRGGLARVINPNLDLGLAFEAGNWRYKHRDTLVPERAEGDLWRLGAFARYSPERWRLRAAIIGGEQDVETTGISLAGAGTSVANYKARVYGAGVEVGYAIAVDGFTLTPHARVNALRWSAPAFAESGGSAPLNGRRTTRDQVRVALGATLGRTYEIAPGFDLGVELGARVFTTAGDVHGRISASDGVSPASFTIDGPPSGRTGAELTAGVTLVKDRRMALAAGYEGRFTGDEQTHAGMLTLKIAL